MRYLLVLVFALVPVAQADEADNVLEFFGQFVNRANAFDTGIVELYSPDARVVTLRDGSEKLVLTGAQWKQLLVRFLPIAKQRGDISTFRDVKVFPNGDGFRVTAVRTSAVKCVSDPNYHLDVVRMENRWMIVEEYTETVSLSQCEPSNELAASLAALRTRLLPHLPMDLDADTRLESVEVMGSALIYHQRLHTVAVAELDLPRLVPLLRQLGVRNACGTREMKKLLDEGATLRYAYVDRNGSKLVNVDIAPGLCI